MLSTKPGIDGDPGRIEAEHSRDGVQVAAKDCGIGRIVQTKANATRELFKDDGPEDLNDDICQAISCIDQR